MLKKLTLVVLTIALAVGLMAVGCYVSTLLVPSTRGVNPLYEEASTVIEEYRREQSTTWARMPPGPERDQAERDWRKRFAHALAEVYVRHGKAPPGWTREHQGNSGR